MLDDLKMTNPGFSDVFSNGSPKNYTPMGGSVSNVITVDSKQGPSVSIVSNWIEIENQWSKSLRVTRNTDIITSLWYRTYVRSSF